MDFKSYLRDRLVYILFYFINTFFVIVIMMLDLIIRKDRLKLANVVYAFLLSLIFLILMMAIDYMKKIRFYKIVNEGLDNSHNLEYIFNIPDHISKEHDVLKELLTTNYMIYEEILEKYKKTIKLKWISIIGGYTK